MKSLVHVYVFHAQLFFRLIFARVLLLPWIVELYLWQMTLTLRGSCLAIFQWLLWLLCLWTRPILQAFTLTTIIDQCLWLWPRIKAILLQMIIDHCVWIWPLIQTYSLLIIIYHCLWMWFRLSRCQKPRFWIAIHPNSRKKRTCPISPFLTVPAFFTISEPGRLENYYAGLHTQSHNAHLSLRHI